jgi:hypothetical protein
MPTPEDTMILFVEQFNGDPSPVTYEDVIDYQVVELGILIITEHLSNDTLRKTHYNTGQWFRFTVEDMSLPKPESKRPGPGGRRSGDPNPQWSNNPYDR